MKQLYAILTVVFVMWFAKNPFAQCPAGQSDVNIDMRPTGNLFLQATHAVPEPYTQAETRL